MCEERVLDLASLPTFDRPHPLSASVITRIDEEKEMSSLVARIRTLVAIGCRALLASCTSAKARVHLACPAALGFPSLSLPRARVPGFKKSGPQGLRRRYQFICKFSSLSVASFVIGRAIHHIEPDNFERRKKGDLEAP